MTNYATLEDIAAIWREMTEDEAARASALLPVVCASLRTEAKKRGQDLDARIGADEDLAVVAKSVTVDVVARALMTSTEGEPVTQAQETSPDYSWSASYLVPGGGLFIKDTELERLGIQRRQRVGMASPFDPEEG